MKHITPCDLESIFRERGIKPDEEFTAASGKDHGYVAAWKLPDGDYLIAYGNNAKTDYAIADDADDLAHWLEDPDLSGLDAILQTANVRGHDALPELDEDAEGPFYVIKTRHYYGSIEQSEIVLDEYENFPKKFESCYKGVIRWIQSKENGGYIADYNESKAPTYTVVVVPK
jgi:hypothetical protein